MNILRRKPVEVSRSPLKDRPLRYAGQSLNEELDRLIKEETLGFLIATGLFGYMTFMEWMRYLFNWKMHPLVWTLVFLTTLLVSLRRFFMARNRARVIRQARDGERAVGEFLERLREHGYQVFHDLIGDNFNVDHVIIGPAGVFTVETKTISKPARGRADVVYDGNEITVGGFTPDRDPLVQARAQASWLRTLLQESTGRSLPVRSLVVYPGWFVTLKNDIRQRDVLVMNPRQIPDLLGKLSAKLSPEEIKLASYHLSRHIRTTEQKPA